MVDRDDKPTLYPLDRATEALRNAPVREGPPPRLVASTVETLQASTTPPEDFRLRKRIILMFRITRYAGLATAVALLIALIGSFWFSDSGTAFADVLKAVKQARSVSFMMASQFGHGPAVGMKWHQQGSVIRYEMPGIMLVMADLEPREAIQLDLRAKRAFKWNMDDEQVRILRQELIDPIEVFGRLRDGDAEKTGEEAVDGRKTVVYRVKKAEFFGIKFKEAEDTSLTVWVDPRTELPVQIALRCSTDVEGKSKDLFLWTDFRWNQPLDAKLLRLDIPEGFKVTQGKPDPGYVFGRTEQANGRPVEGKQEPKLLIKEIDFARVIGNVNKTRSVACEVHTKMGGGGIGAELYLNEDGARRNSLVVQIEDFKQGKAVRFHGRFGFGVLAGSDQAYRWSVEKRQLTEMSRRFPNPAMLFHNMKSEDAEKIRAARVDGRTVAVYRVKNVALVAAIGEPDEAFDTNLYVSVDPRTELPTEISLNCAAPGKMEIKTWFRWEKLKWDEPLDPDLFKLEIPKGHAILEGPPPEGSLWPDIERLIGAQRTPGK